MRLASGWMTSTPVALPILSTTFSANASPLPPTAGYPAALFRGVGCYVEADLVAPDINLLFSRPFVFVDESFGEAFARSTALPGGMCLTAYYDDCHADDGSDLDASRLSELFDYMDAHGLEPAGPLTMENIFRFMRLFNQDAHAYFRYCLPVRPARGQRPVFA